MFNILKFYFVKNEIFKKKKRLFFVLYKPTYFKYLVVYIKNIRKYDKDSIYKITYRFNLNFNFYYIFKFNNNPGYSFSKNYKTKKYKKSKVYLKNDKNDLLLSLKFIYYIYNKMIKKNQKRMVVFFF